MTLLRHAFFAMTGQKTEVSSNPYLAGARMTYHDEYVTTLVNRQKNNSEHRIVRA